MDALTTLAWVISFVVVTVGVTGLAGRAGVSAPIVLVIVGAAASFIPGLPEVHLQPEVVLYVILPPLLYAAAIRTSFTDVRARRDSILLLSVGLVAFTVVVIGFVTWWIVPAVSLAAAFAFGAVVAPTDAVAITAISGRLGLPRRVVTVLEGESLLNDATALVALNAAVAAIISVLNPITIVGDFALAVVVGVGMGLLVGFILAVIRSRLRAPVLDTALSLVTPYIAFVPAQLLHGSGVLAVVVAGLFLGARSPIIQTAEARIAENINWRTIQFLLENAVFLFIGLSLYGIVKGAITSGVSILYVVLAAVGVLIALLLSRFIWMLFTTGIYRWGPEAIRERGWSWRTGIAVSFAGIRGVVTLAAVLLLPNTPGRSFLQLLALLVVIGTILGGLPLPAVIRRLKLPRPDTAQEASEMQRLLAEAQQAGIERLDLVRRDSEDERVIAVLRTDALFLSEALDNPRPDAVEDAPTAYRRLRRAMLSAERRAVLQARRDGRFQEPAVQAVLAFLDAEEAALRRSSPRDPGSGRL